MSISRFSFQRKCLLATTLFLILLLFIVEKYLPKDDQSVLPTNKVLSERSRGLTLIPTLNLTRQSNSSEILLLMQENPNIKLILTWRTIDSSPFYRDSWMSGCLDYPCILTHHRDLLNYSSAVVFHGIDWNDTPQYRTPDQLYVFQMWESPYHTHADLRSPQQRNFFNLTQTYRLDSDIYSPYGRFYELDDPVPLVNILSVVSGKNRTAAWFVTNCHTPSKREQIVEELQKFIKVDVYGVCGPFRCGRDVQRKCDLLLDSSYYFYLAFENSICLDYVTEKFFERLDSRIVPVVLLRSNYEKIAPGHSFIAVSDFNSIKSLADYLNYLTKNHTAYGEYLYWRQHYTTSNSSLHNTARNHGFCGLCEVLHNETYAKGRSHANLNTFWHIEAKCNTRVVDKLLPTNSPNRSIVNKKEQQLN